MVLFIVLSRKKSIKVFLLGSNGHFKTGSRVVSDTRVRHASDMILIFFMHFPGFIVCWCVMSYCARVGMLVSVQHRLSVLSSL